MSQSFAPLWGNTYLLRNPIFSHFNDSMSAAPMGKILAIDTGMVDSAANYAALLSALNTINPVNNIEANLQTATWGYLTYRINNTLSPSDLVILRTLANKCPDWDGNGVYQARALLSLFDSPSTVYPNGCGSREEHRPEKKNEVIESVFNLYPNPNNGGFTLSYQLQQGQSGTFTIFDMLGKEISTYMLKPNETTMSIDETTLNNGVYLYSIVVNNNVVKEDKLVIIK